jgi:hypothetical protein
MTYLPVRVGGEGKGTEHAYSGQGGTLSVEDKVRLVDVAKEASTSQDVTPPPKCHSGACSWNTSYHGGIKSCKR